MFAGTHRCPWDILRRTVGWDRHIGLTCAMVHMGVPGISYLCPSYEVGRDRHIGLTFVVVHMGVLGISYIEQCDRIDT